jgi:hypothetical protein
MQKVYTLFALLVICSSANAQIQKGTILLGGQLNYGNSTSENISNLWKFRGTNIGLSAGKAFRENAVVGFTLGFSHSKQTQIYSGTDTTTITGNGVEAGVFFRQYKTLVKDLYFFGQVEASFASSRQTATYTSLNRGLKSISGSANLTLTPGIAYQVFRKLQLELTVPGMINLAYSWTRNTDSDPQSADSKQNSFSLSSRTTGSNGAGWLAVGFRFLL